MTLRSNAGSDSQSQLSYHPEGRHITRESWLWSYCLDSGEELRQERAIEILKVISLQDQNPDSRTYGIWSGSEEFRSIKCLP